MIVDLQSAPTANPRPGSPGTTPLAVPAIVTILIHDLVSDDASRLDRDDDHISALVADFRQRQRDRPHEHPVQNPLRVLPRGDKFFIVTGNYRYLAALRVGLRDLPCIVLPAELGEADLFIEIVKDNRLHKEYSPIEDARNVLRVKELRGCSQAEAGRLIGIANPAEVTKLLRVLRGFPEDLFPLIGDGDGKVPFTTAYTLARLDDESTIRGLVDKVVRGLLTRDAAEDEVQRLLGTRKQPNDGRVKPVTVKLPGLTATFTVARTAEARALIAQVDAAALKLEKHKLPFTSLPDMFHSPPEP
jgi:ParB-like chromosome segregation protein Spo0J